MRHTHYFTLKEFECPCCGLEEMASSTVAKLDAARSTAGVPFIVTSGTRCEKHNMVVGGSPTSSHLVSKIDNKSHAVDIVTITSQIRHKILVALIEAGFKRIGIGFNFIHADDDPAKHPGVIWLYNGGGS